MKFIGLSSWLLLASLIQLQAVEFRGLGESSSVNALSANGRVAVGSITNMAFRWSGGQHEIITPQAPLGGKILSGSLRCVSSDGHIFMGFFLDDAQQRNQLYRLNFDGLTKALGWRAGANSVSDEGIAVGFGTPGYPGNQAAVALWTSDSTSFYLGTLTTNYYASSVARSITPDGVTVVGESHEGLQYGGWTHAFYWTAQSGMVDMGAPDGFFNSAAADISHQTEVIVGNAWRDEGGSIFTFEPFLWTAAEGFQLLGSPYQTGSPYLRPAIAVNGDGSIIVGNTLTTNGWSPFIWDATNGVRHLEDVFASAGLDFTGWQLGEVMDISGDGTVIVGRGTNASNEAESWLAVLSDSNPSYDVFPEKPIGLQAQLNANLHVELSWNPSQNATGYKILSKENTNLWSLVATVDGSQTNFVDTAIPQTGILRAYKISATNAVDYSAYSTEATVKRPNGVFALEFDTYIAGEHQGEVLIKVLRTEASMPPRGAASVTFSTQNGSATAGLDYVATNGTVLFGENEWFKTVSIQLLNDHVSEYDESVFINLSNPSPGTSLGTPSQAILIITNSERGELSFAASNLTVFENAGKATVTVLRKHGVSGPIACQFATADGTAQAGVHYLATNGVLSFANGESSKSFDITILDNAVLDGSKTVHLSLAGVDGARVSAPTNSTLSILDNEVGLGFASEAFEVSGDAAHAVITVTRSGLAGPTVRVDFATSDQTAIAGVDYTDTHGTLTFNPGETIKTFTVPLLQGQGGPSTNTVLLSLFNPFGAQLMVSNAVLSIRKQEMAQPHFVLQHADRRVAVASLDNGVVHLRLLRNGRPVAPGWRLAGLGDFNGDEQPDILWQNTNGTLAAWYLDGTNIISAGFLISAKPVANGWRAVGVADLNGDTKPDILWQHETGRLAAWFMDRTNRVSSTLLRDGKPVLPGWQLAGLSDLNRNGKTDFLWQHSDGRLGVWYMNGIQFLGSGQIRNHLGNPLGQNWRAMGLWDKGIQGGNPCMLIQHKHVGLYLVEWQMAEVTMGSTSKMGDSQILHHADPAYNGWRIEAIYPEN